MSKALCSDIIGTVWVTGANASLSAAANPLGDRVRGDQLGIGLLERNEFVVEPIPFGVGDLGGVEFVVLLGVVVEGRPQFVDAVGRRVSV